MNPELKVISTYSTSVVLEIKSNRKHDAAEIGYKVYNKTTHKTEKETKEEKDRIKLSSLFNNELLIEGLQTSTNYGVQVTLYTPGIIWGQYKDTNQIDFCTLPNHPSFDFFMLQNKQPFIDKKKKEINDKCSNENKEIHIMFVGELGSGKSSTCQSIYTSMTGDAFVRFSSNSSQQTTSRATQRAKINNHVTMHDLFGTENDLYEEYLDGILQGKYEVVVDDKGKTEKVYTTSNVIDSKSKTFISTVVIVADMMSTKQSNIQSRIRAFTRNLANKNIPVVMVISKVDEVIKNVPSKGYFDDKEFVEQIDLLVKECKVDKKYIFPISNEISIDKQYREAMALDILYAATILNNRSRS